MVERAARALLRLLLWTWPARSRREFGRDAVETAVRMVAEAREGGMATACREIVAEASALLVGGLRLRTEGMGGQTRGWMMGWSGDVRFAVRTLRRSPGFAVVAISTLALGIGANGAVFALVRDVLLAPPPYTEPERLLLVWNRLPGTDERIPVAGPDAAVLRERAGSLEGVAFTIRGVDGAIETADGDAALHVRIAAVTDDFFTVLGAPPRLGRAFDPRDGVEGASADGATGPPAVLLADGIWRAAFAADPGIVGTTVRLNGVPVTVVGIMPPDFTLALPPDAGVDTDVDVWTPLRVPLTAFHRTDERLLDQDSDNSGAVVARLRPGATLADAQADAARIAGELRAEVPGYAAAGLDLDVRALQADATAHARPVLLALLAGAGLVLLVACLNLATLLVARGAARDRELAIRVSLGADRRRLARQLLVETGTLATAGCGAAVAVASLGARALSRLAPDTLGQAAVPAVDPAALAFAAGLAGGAMVLFGLLPGLRHGGRAEGPRLRAGALRGASPARRGRRMLVVAEVAVSVVLVLCTGLLLRTVSALEKEHAGFVADGALTFRLSLRVPERYAGPAARAETMDRVRAGLAELPGVRAVGIVGALPLGGERWTQPYGLPGQAPDEWRANRADFRVVTSGTFDALGTRLLDGRAFTPREDVVEEDRVVVIDRTLADRIAPGGSAVGSVIGIPLDGQPVEARVVGVVEPVRYDRLDGEAREAVYVPYRQEASRDVAFVVRTSGDPASLAPAVRRVVQEVDPMTPVYDLLTLEDYVARAVAPRRFALTLILAFAGLALGCVAVGLYGVVAFEVARGTRDIGLRMAVGATRSRVVLGVLLGGARLGGLGLLIGAGLGLLVARAFDTVTWGVGAADPLVWASVLGTVALVTLCACALPALRASRLDPTIALRAE